MQVRLCKRGLFWYDIQVFNNNFSLQQRRRAYLDRVPVGDGVDQGIKVEGWQIRVLCLDEHHIWSVVPERRSNNSGYSGSQCCFIHSLFGSECSFSYQVRWT